MPSPEYPLPCRIQFYLMFVRVNDVYMDVLLMSWKYSNKILAKQHSVAHETVFLIVH